jgi:hypothetical protein
MVFLLFIDCKIGVYSIVNQLGVKFIKLINNLQIVFIKSNYFLKQFNILDTSLLLTFLNYVILF